MAKRRGQGVKLLFAAAFLLLSGVIIVLLAASLQFFSMPEVRAQFEVWASGLVPGFFPTQPVAAALPAENRPAVSSQRHTAAESPFAAAEERVRPATAGLPIQPYDEAGELRLPRNVPPVPTPAVPAEVPVVEGPIEPSIEREEPKEPERPAVPDGTLQIPALELEKQLIQIPVLEGDWDTTGLGQEIGWLETTGTKPGGQQAMVVIGHVTLANPRGPGPFFELETLKPGDEILYTADDRQYVYQVSEQRTVAPDDVASLYVADGQKIILVTCENWNFLTKQYEERLLVEAQLVRTQRLNEVVE